MKQFVVRHFTAGLLLVLLSAVIPFSLARAEEGTFRESITLSPTSSRFEVDAGETATGKLTVINDGETDYDFIVYARPYSVQDENYTPEFTQQLSNTDAYSWIQFDKVSYHLNPGASTEIQFDLVVPAKAAPGGHYGVIFAETQPKTDGSSIARKKRVGSLVYATVKGEYIMKGSVASTQIAPLQFRSPLSASISVKNEGNADFITKTELRISDVFGHVKYDATNEYPILPDTIRKIPLEWQNSPWFGVYKVDVSTTMLDQPTVTTTGYVLIAPRWLLIFVGLFIVGGIVYAILHRRKH